jgi:predicted amidohydrolase YtcJ
MRGTRYACATVNFTYYCLMRIFSFVRNVFFLSLIAAVFASYGQQLAPDLIFTDGKIFTSVPQAPYVEALAIRGDRIVAVGDSQKIKALASPRTRQIDLGGRTVIPGINDAHDHLGVTPSNWSEMEFATVDPPSAEVARAVVAAVAKQPSGTFIFGEIGVTAFHDLRIDRDYLDKLSPHDPVVLQTFTGHAMILNSAALTALGVGEKKKDPVAGRFERFPDGRLNGVVREYAVLGLNRRLADMTPDPDAVAQFRDLLTQAAKFGITSIQDMSDSLAPQRAVKLLEQVPTPIRIRIMRMPGTSPEGRDTSEGWPAPEISNPLITVNGMKWMLDGVPIEGTLTPRRDSIDTAEMFSVLPLSFGEKEMSAMLHESLQHNEQLMVHVSGYPSAAAMLSAMKTNGGSKVWNGKRVRFEHGDGLFPGLIPAVKEMGIVVVQNPTHFNGPAMAPEIVAEMARVKGQPLRSLLEAGIPVALGSDGPMNPYLNIMFASIHPDRPDEAISREQAVIAYTATSAYAEFAEKERGTLAPGKLADIAVLSQDIFSVPAPDLPKTTSVLTLVGGKIVYDAGVFSH